MVEERVAYRPASRRALTTGGDRMSLFDDYCPDHSPCPECGARCCMQCGDNVVELADGSHICGDCQDLQEAS